MMPAHESGRVAVPHDDPVSVQTSCRSYLPARLSRLLNLCIQTVSIAMTVPHASAVAEGIAVASSVPIT